MRKPYLTFFRNRIKEELPTKWELLMLIRP